MHHLVLVFSVAVFGCAAAQDTGYTECQPGTLNIILAAPHGGSVEPSNIPSRDAGCWDGPSQSCIYSHDCGNKDSDRCGVVTSMDVNTQQLTRKMREELYNIFGEYPTAVYNLLHRRKHDANRDKPEATFGVAVVEAAWDEWHQCIDAAKDVIEASSGGRGIFYDIHGHGHPDVWAELGYLISRADLDSGQDLTNPSTTSIRSLAGHVDLEFDELVRGDLSFGDFMERENYAAVPSSENLGPGGKQYFTGGYNTQRHGSRNGGQIDAIQIESHRSPRDDFESYGPALARAIAGYVCTHYPEPPQACEDFLALFPTGH